MKMIQRVILGLVLFACGVTPLVAEDVTLQSASAGATISGIPTATESSMATKPAPEPTNGDEAWRTLFPEGLTDAAGKKAELSRLRNKVIGLYFSAHWCYPCKLFTPKLLEFRTANQKDFEVVFISSDEDEAGRAAYIKEAGMTWLTIPWNPLVAESLRDRYSVEGIPFLVILGPNGKTIAEDGREEIRGNASGAMRIWQTLGGLRD